MGKIKLDNASKIYKRGKEEVHALQDCNLELEAGDYISVMGPSGSGKSTLLKAIATSLELSAGDVYIDDLKISDLNDKQKSSLRAERIGYIVQDFMLIGTETVYDNIRIPLLYNKSIPRKEHKARIAEAAEKLGITSLLKDKAKNLSGGESQRVAIARAICGDQDIILADEPTGALDVENRDKILDIFTQLNQEDNKTVVVVSHDPLVARHAKQIYQMQDGVLTLQ